MMDNIILIGYMGCGKTTLGIRLSYHMRIPFVDTDKMIEKNEGREISEIFAQDGEEAFRQMETRTIQTLLQEKARKVISTGGGLPIREENRQLLKQLGTVVWLKAEPETVYERVKGDTRRPLLQCEDPLAKIREMTVARSPYYQEAADVVIQVDGKDFDTIIQEMEGQIR